MTLNVFTAIMLTVAGFSLAIREIVLSPTNRTFPCAPLAVRLAMFIAATALGGLAILFYYQPGPYAGAAAVPVACFCSIMAIYNVIMLANLFQQRFPAKVWRKIDRIEAVVRGPATAEIRPLRRPASR